MSGSLTEVAEQVGITHAGVLHHFGSKEQLLVEVLEYRDKEDVRDLEGQHIPGGLELFHHLLRTARLNVDRRGIVQGYTVLTGESVTENHPARTWVTERFAVLRGEIRTALLAVGERRRVRGARRLRGQRDHRRHGRPAGPVAPRRGRRPPGRHQVRDRGDPDGDPGRDAAARTRSTDDPSQTFHRVGPGVASGGGRMVGP